MSCNRECSPEPKNLYDEYKENALKTWAQPDQKQMIDVEILKVALLQFIQAGTILDQMKKQVFYGQHDRTKVVDATYKLEHLLSANKVKCNDVYKASKPVNVDLKVVHACMGIATEGVEIAERLLTIIEKDKIEDSDVVNLGEEFSDAGYYLTVGCHELNLDVKKLLKANNDKLINVRFKKGFSQEAAVKRDLDAEQEILNGIMEQS